MNQIPDLVGTWYTDPYNAAFPEDTEIYPTGKGLIEAKIIVTRQEDNLLWFQNYWKFVEDEAWNMEPGTGVINAQTQQVTLVEADPRPEIGSTGVFTLTPYKNDDKYQRCYQNSYYLTYKGLGGGISFSSILHYEGQTTTPLSPLVGELDNQETTN